MNPMHYMELLSDLPDDLVDCAFLTDSSGLPQKQSSQAIRSMKGERMMKEHGQVKQKHTPLLFGRAGIAAAVAICIALNAALICGIRKMRAADSLTPGMEISMDAEQPELSAADDDTEESVQPDDDSSPDAEPVTVPDFIGMDWESAKQTAKECGIQPIRFLMDSDEYPAGTVVAQGKKYSTSSSGSFIVLHVAKREGEQSIAMKFNASGCLPNKIYYYYVRNEAGEIIGATFPFSFDGTSGYTTDYLYPDCSEENTKVTVVLVDRETKQEAIVGSYILHPENAAYDTISEDIEAAFRAVNE